RSRRHSSLIVVPSRPLSGGSMPSKCCEGTSNPAPPAAFWPHALAKRNAVRPGGKGPTMTDEDLEEIAADFWAETALGDVFPRNIEQALALKLPVTVVKLSMVTVRTIGHWLQKHHRCPAFPAYRRDLMGCLYADGGQGFIFVCGADEPEE